jgi:Methyltransferase domain
MSLVKGALRRTLEQSFPVWERFRVHVTPVHFYSPVPDTRELAPAIWETHSEMVGVDLGEDAQLALLGEFSDRYGAEYSSFPSEAPADPTRYFVNNGMFASVDGEMLYAFVRWLHPRRIIEAGSGFSTRLIAQALQANEVDGAGSCEYTVCDPFPGSAMKEGVTRVSRLVERRVQELPLSEFVALGENDILFIDSSHVLKIGSDVQYLFLEVIPRLAPGVVVHVHDIFLPAEYPRQWVMNDHHFWNEQYLLQAFLAFNRSWDVLWAGSFMHLKHSDRLAKAFPSYGPTRHPGSFWMRRNRTEPSGVSDA